MYETKPNAEDALKSLSCFVCEAPEFYVEDDWFI